MRPPIAIIVLALALVGCAKKQKPVLLEETLAETQVEEAAEQKAVEARVDDGGDEYARVPIYFAYDSAELTHDSRSELARLAATMLHKTSLELTIEGNTDSRGSTEYNLALGERRARAAREYLVHLGVGGKRVDVVSYGEERPAAEGDVESAWARNRRDEFVLTN